MKRILCLSLLMMALFSACKKDEKNNSTPDPDSAGVMFMHAMLTLDSMNITANNNTIVSGLYPLGSTGYIDLAIGNTSFQFKSKLTSLTLEDTSLNLAVNNRFSVFPTGLPGSSTVFVTADDLSSPGADSAKVRLVNLSLSDLNESLFIGASQLATDVSYREATAFYKIKSGSANILVQDPAKPTLLLQLPSYPFAAGKIYTVVVTGNEGGSGIAELKLTVLENN